MPFTVLSGHDLNMSPEPLFADLGGSSDGFSQEQAWIWGMETPMQPFGHE